MGSMFLMRASSHILYCHYIIIWQSLIPIAPPDFFSRRSNVGPTALRLPCFTVRCRTANIASAIPLFGIKPNCASVSLLSITLSQIFKIYQLYPSASPTILDVSLHSVDIYYPASIHFASDNIIVLLCSHHSCTLSTGLTFSNTVSINFILELSSFNLHHFILGVACSGVQRFLPYLLLLMCPFRYPPTITLSPSSVALSS